MSSYGHEVYRPSISGWRLPGSGALAQGPFAAWSLEALKPQVRGLEALGMSLGMPSTNDWLP